MTFRETKKIRKWLQVLVTDGEKSSIYCKQFCSVEAAEVVKHVIAANTGETSRCINQ
jgi:hypothetical protein